MVYCNDIPLFFVVYRIDHTGNHDRTRTKIFLLRSVMLALCFVMAIDCPQVSQCILVNSLRREILAAPTSIQKQRESVPETPSTTDAGKSVSGIRTPLKHMRFLLK